MVVSVLPQLCIWFRQRQFPTGIEERGLQKRRCQERSQLINVFGVVNRESSGDTSINFSENAKLYKKEIINAKN